MFFNRFSVPLNLMLLVSSLSIAQGGKVSEDLSLYSSILKQDRNYAVYLPPDYETSQRSYPVLYLLQSLP